ncbi:MarR family transcriptional regulator [Microbacterium sp. AZCO]|uniref:MarR family winged helix-turn-helix transcriptional regulator n=1 Tax=Microbacterium sp. AZCO TaxID=3142976 RepID=UPI0031F39A90
MTTEGDRVAQIQAAWQRERPDLDVSPQAVIARLHRVALELTERLTVVYAEHGLTEGDFDVLATLRRTGEPYERLAGELADHTLVTTGGLTKRVDRLIGRGLVERRAEASDARRRLIRLTPEGKRVIDRAFAAHMANERRLLDDLGPADAAAIEPILTRWLALLENGEQSRDQENAPTSGRSRAIRPDHGTRP